MKATTISFYTANGKYTGWKYFHTVTALELHSRFRSGDYITRKGVKVTNFDSLLCHFACCRACNTGTIIGNTCINCGNYNQ